MFELSISEDDVGVRLDKFLRKQFPNVPVSHLFKLVRTKNLRLNNQRAKPQQRLAAGDIVRIRKPLEALSTPLARKGGPSKTPLGARPRQAVPSRAVLSRAVPSYAVPSYAVPSYAVPGQAVPSRAVPSHAVPSYAVPSRAVPSRAVPSYAMPLHILHEDDWILVVDKPSGMAVHPGSGIPHGTVVDFVRAYLGEKAVRNGFAASPVHRLDKDTSGVLVVAKRRPAMVHFTKLLTEGRIKKAYLTLVKGRLPSPQGKIEVALAERQQSHASKLQHGRRMQAAKTLWWQLECQNECTLLSVALETGRTHQIRRHFSSWSRPVLGDSRYGDFIFNRMAKKRWGLGRMFLHACALEFAHPEDGAEVCILSKLPVELDRVLENMGFSSQKERELASLGGGKEARKQRKESG